ncbi:MAG: hypothetical protein K0S47_3954 [Herbinix sp.]|jgi:hypothetical protein|nr:hypothetical protein [Herbinix sp.]
MISEMYTESMDLPMMMFGIYYIKIKLYKGVYDNEVYFI